MNTQQLAELRENLAAFEVDDPQAAVPFSARLAKENGWTRAYALRVIEEYKRFVFLCMIADRPPCPSEQVDEAWHLHLTFTRSYWTVLCGEVLKRPLHHEPTRGGADEHAKHIELYEHTRALYRTTFSEEPPREIWPPSAIRFGEDTQHRKVNLRRNWVIPNPFARLRKWRSKYAAFALAGFPLLALAWNPLEWRGPEFLAFFVVSYAIALLLGWLLRMWLRNESPAKLDPPLSAVELAQLARGKRGAITTVMSELISKDVLRLEQTESKFLGITVSSHEKLVSGVGIPANTLEEALTKAVLAHPHANLKDLGDAASPMLDKTEANLVNRGLVYEPQDVFFARFVPVALMTLVLILGVSKIAIGVWREKPVVLLIIGSIIALATIFVLARNIRRSKAGNQLIEELQAKHAAWNSPTTNGDIGAGNVAFAVALFGTTALAGTSYANLNEWERQSFGNVRTDASSGSGCGSGCGGGGGGCGGGGCGGCGGCGGG